MCRGIIIYLDGHKYDLSQSNYYRNGIISIFNVKKLVCYRW